MFVLRIGSTCSMQISSIMPPHKKLKTDPGAPEPEILNISSESETELGDLGSNWREQCMSTRAKFNYALKKNILADVKLVVGEEARVFHCHRLILAIGSPVFEAMFFGELAETGDSVTIPDVDPEGFEQLIRYFYTSEISLKKEATAFKTYFAADKYCVTDLKKMCDSFLCSCEVSPSNVWVFLENSIFLNSELIKHRCVDVLKKSLQSSLEESSFLDINFNTMEFVLNIEGLEISEKRLLKHIIQWAEHRSQLEAAFQDTLRPLLVHIRFGALTASEFVEFHANSRLREVLSEKDCLAILEHLIMPAQCPLPDWCCTKKQRSPFIMMDDLLDHSSKARKKKSKQHKFYYKRPVNSPVLSHYNSSDSEYMGTSDSSTSSSSDSSDSG